jgi:AraC family transcriptional regulator
MKKINHITVLAHRIAVNKVIDFIEDNISEKLDLEELANVANLSKFHFLRIFKTLVGETPLQFIMRLRIEKIASLLIHRPNESIGNIAGEFGFLDLTNFSKNFKMYYGVSATEWRIENSNIHQADSNKVQTQNKSLEYYCQQTNLEKIEVAMPTCKSMEIKNIAPFTVAYLRHIGSYISTEKIHDKMWANLFAWANPRGYTAKSDLKTLIVYHDNAYLTPAEKQRMSFCISVPDDIKAEGKIGKMMIEGGKYIALSFEMRPEEFMLAWDWVFKWIPESGYETDVRYCFEMYTGVPKNGLFGVDIYISIK